MFEYHLSASQIGEASKDRPREEIDFQLFHYACSDSERAELWRSALLKAIADTNFAKVILTGDKDNRACVIVAREVDIAYVKYLYSYLSETIVRLSPRFHRLEGKGTPWATWDRAFCMGAVKAIRVTLEEQQARDSNQEGGTALILRSDSAVKDKFDELYPKTRKNPGQRNIDAGAYNIGQREGSKIGINRPIGGGRVPGQIA